ncbi:MAG: photosystem II protein PsbQ [Cyanobacteriota bacterium]|nr:photosystem II protein PsbQ [Cyanobacteriota bacterium]
MKRLRSILPLILALVATVLVACGGPNVAKAPPTYTPEKVAQLERYLTPVATARERMSELPDLLEKEDWVFVRNFIHGPLGQLRGSMSFISRNLLPKDQDTAARAADELFEHLDRIDLAAKDKNYPLAVQQYREAVKDFDTFLNLVPAEAS